MNHRRDGESLETGKTVAQHKARTCLPDPARQGREACLNGQCVCTIGRMTTDDLQTLRERTVALVLARAPGDGLHETALPWLRLIRASAPAQPVPAIYEPGLVLVLQGRKQAQLGERVVHYDAMQCLLVPVTT